MSKRINWEAEERLAEKDAWDRATGADSEFDMKLFGFLFIDSIIPELRRIATALETIARKTEE